MPVQPENVARLVASSTMHRANPYGFPKFSHADFAALPLKLDQQMQRSISALKALAQIALIHSVSNFSAGLACQFA